MVIVTAGAWAPEILAPLGIDTRVVPQKGQILHLGLSGVETKDWPVLLPQNSYYMLAFDDSRVVVGATRETGSGFDYRVTAGGEAEVLGFGLAYAPGLRNATLIETRVGFRPAGPSFVPMLGPVPGIDGLLIGNGLGAGGLTLGPPAACSPNTRWGRRRRSTSPIMRCPAADPYCIILGSHSTRSGT